MWNVKSKLIAVIRGATRAISKSLRQCLSNIPGKHEIKELQNSHIGHWTHTYCGKCYCNSTKRISRAK